MILEIKASLVIETHKIKQIKVLNFKFGSVETLCHLWP